MFKVLGLIALFYFGIGLFFTVCCFLGMKYDGHTYSLGERLRVSFLGFLIWPKVIYDLIIDAFDK